MKGSHHFEKPKKPGNPFKHLFSAYQVIPAIKLLRKRMQVK